MQAPQYLQKVWLQEIKAPVWSSKTSTYGDIGKALMKNTDHIHEGFQSFKSELSCAH